MQAMDDMALLREYAARNSEAAFETLVSRRVGFVYSAALRQVRDPHLAEEVTQAVFIILAQKAGRISDKTILTGWLFKTTRFAALAQMRAAARRRQYEQEAQMQSELQQTAADEFWAQLSSLLDEALAHLGETDRQAMLLRFFENQSMAEVGSSLGMSEDTARKRVSRALEKLHRYFTKRGVSSTTAIIAGTISANSVQVAPSVLAKTVTAVAMTKGTVASASTLTLIQGALKIMAWTKAKTAIVASVVVLAAAGTATVTVHHLAQKRADPFKDFEKQMRQQPGFALTMEAADFLHQLRMQGKLPGFQKDEQGNILLPGFRKQGNALLLPTGTTNAESYPIFRTLQVRKTGPGPFPYHYTVEKASETNSWQLQKAWRTDTNDQVVEEFPVP